MRRSFNLDFEINSVHASNTQTPRSDDVRWRHAGRSRRAPGHPGCHSATDVIAQAKAERLEVEMIGRRAVGGDGDEMPSAEMPGDECAVQQWRTEGLVHRRHLGTEVEFVAQAVRISAVEQQSDPA